MKKQKVFVIGHKNPDTDSICSAISYAYLKNKTDDFEYIPMRSGKLSDETRFVLNRFSMEEPELMKEAGTQVIDMEIRKVEGVDQGISLKKAWSLMKELNVTTLPITQEKKLIGLITTEDIAQSYMDIYDSRILSTADTHYKNIIETLDGELVVGSDDIHFSQGKVLIAAANPDLMENLIDKGDMVILGNRYESQLCAIEMDAACIVVCEGASVSMTIKKIAKEHKCTIISSPHDTYTVARLINQSMPIKYFMCTKNLISFQTEDYIEDIKNVMAKYRHRYFPVLDNYKNYLGVISRRNLLNVSKKKIILVDHNEKGQAPDGIMGAEILEIIDHHRLGTIETINPVYFRNQPLGCTATIIYQMFCEKGIEIPTNIAGLLCSAIISDTLLYSSVTCTEIDRTAAEALAKIANIDSKEYAKEMFKAGSDLKEKTGEEIFHQDFKVFNVDDKHLFIGQINTINNDELENIKLKITEYMKAKYTESETEIAYFMLTSILEESTKLIYYGEKAREIAQDAFEVEGDEYSMYLKGIMSRKKQVVPALIEAIQDLYE
ncbi:MAG: putative manganese-dependent inorganic diphosphatase [Mobilitalea sp.]